MTSGNVELVSSLAINCCIKHWEKQVDISLRIKREYPLPGCKVNSCTVQERLVQTSLGLKPGSNILNIQSFYENGLALHFPDAYEGFCPSSVDLLPITIQFVLFWGFKNFTSHSKLIFTLYYFSNSISLWYIYLLLFRDTDV